MFRFKHFAVNDEGCAMKVGTDGVLLGAWATHDRPAHILDIGTGSGLIALMLAQRYPQAVIYAIDIDADACGQALSNFMDSPWSERLSVEHTDLQHFSSGCSYDLIVSNPPFFQNSLRAPDPQRSLARHTDALPYSELLSHSRRLLTDNGTIALIVPYTQKEYILSLAREQGLHASDLVAVVSKPGKSPKRLLIALTPDSCNLTDNGDTHCPTQTDDELITHKEERLFFIEGKETSRSEEYQQLTREFYL